MGTVSSPPNPEKARAFARRTIDIINDGALALLISIGHRTGLFDVMADRAPSTAEEIAEAAGLLDPYVREWLEGMARGGIVLHDPSSGTYELPAEHAASLAGAVSQGNLAAVAEYVPLLGASEDQIVSCFQKGGHTPYDARPSFRQVISKKTNESDQEVVATLVDSILPLVPGLLDALRSGIDVLDVGCGSGRAVNLLASTFPSSRFRGYDPVERRIERASRGAFELGLNNVFFKVKDLADLDETARYDLITDFDAIREEPRPAQVLGNIARALRPGGALLMQEVAASTKVDESLGLPPDSALHTVSSMQRMAGSPKDWGALRGEQRVRTLLLESGFERVVVQRLPHHIYNCYFVATRGSG